MYEVQRLTDALAQRLRRSVEVDDLNLHPLAISEQFEPVDEVRVRSVLARRSSDDVIAFVFSADIAHATHPVRYQANPGLGTLPRICIPLLADDKRFGYLWLIDSPSVLDDELDDARRTAAEIATLLHDSASHELNSLDHEIELTAKLASGESPGSELLGKVPAAEILTGGKQLVVVAVRMLATEADVGGDQIRRLLHEVTWARPTGRSLLGHSAGTVTLVLPDNGPVGDRVRSFIRAVTDAALHHGWSAHGSGIGPVVRSALELADARAKAAYAAAVANGRGEELLIWDCLGSDAAFYGLPWDRATVLVFHPGVGPLLEPRNRQLRETVEVYLASGGDTQAAAKQLAIHRTTLYYRLNRANDLLGADWSTSGDRVGLHLALRLDHLMRNSSRAPDSVRTAAVLQKDKPRT
ncbi:MULTISPECIES: PucR family transcriptional regulator [Streptomyces]|uniref:PucR family transcriptional regulator n=1 Tax=Streptomyces TaxID=1883 RepID=UPI000A374324|nr:MULTISPECIES: helix-turn-helix domain-containing protein [Streptomyces]MDX3630417.1 helix-turn-helix domain-containing protein [Streptomyces europaeiscabiei]MDX3648554.1 helix-turn-helix domain-containing protein [Streptomyces europaeiscabiei]